MSRAAVFSVLLTAGVLGGLATTGGTALAGPQAQFQHTDRGRQDWRDDRRDDRYDRRHDRRDDRREWRDSRQDHRWSAPPRHYAPPRYVAPRYYVPPRTYYDYRRHDRWPYWRQSYNGGYRYWDNGHHYFVAPGGPAVELRFVLPLH